MRNLLVISVRGAGTQTSGLCPRKVLILCSGRLVLLDKQTLLLLNHPPSRQCPNGKEYLLHNVVDILAQNVERLGIDVGVGNERSKVDCGESASNTNRTHRTSATSAQHRRSRSWACLPLTASARHTGHAQSDTAGCCREPCRSRGLCQQ